MFKKDIFSLIIACLMLTQVSAQDEETLHELYELPPAEPGDLICRAVCTFVPENEETFYFKMGDTYHEVGLVGEAISIKFPVRDTNTFILYSKSLTEEGEVIYVPLFEQALEGSGQDFLVILRRPKDTQSLQSRAYNISTDNYPAGNLHVFNESSVALGMRVDEQNALIEPYGSHSHEFEEVGRNSYTSAKIAISYKGEAKIMSSKRIRVLPGRRVIMICFPSIARVKMGATPLRVITLQDMPKGNS